MKAIRKSYEEHGVDKYYSDHAAGYENPHFEQVRALLQQSEDKIDYSNVLDFACGGGEVSLVLREMGYSGFTGADPYTHALYEQQLGLPCRKWSFDDAIRGKLEGQYSAVICSFALHLCPLKQLYPLAMGLLRHAPLLVLLTPHKRPDFSMYGDFELVFEDFVLTGRGKKVRMRGIVCR